jgi:cardiolipin synthase A/B
LVAFIGGMKAILVLFVAGACAADTAIDESEPVLDGKADGSITPIPQGTVTYGTPQPLAFPEGAAGSVVYVAFELTSDAQITLDVQADVDTRLYVYHPTNDVWHRSIARGDSQLSLALPAGEYRALVIRKGDPAGARAAILATCSGAGCTPPIRGCTPRESRRSIPDVFVGPTQWQSSITAAIDSATVSLDVQMYLFTVTAIADAIVAAHDRGIAVRVLLDPDEPNGLVVERLQKAGIEVRFDPATFAFAHAKYMIVDHARTVIMSGNFNAGAMSSERNYAIVDRDSDDVFDVQAIFESDWAGGPAPDLGCTRLVVSPVNAGDRILALARGAQTTLDIESLYLTETDLQSAIIDAHERGVAVRVLLSDPKKNTQNVDTQKRLLAAGVPTKFLFASYLHAKMIQADGIAHVGSENMSRTSWTLNREVGAQIFEAAPAGVIHDQFEADWVAAVDQP